MAKTVMPFIDSFLLLFPSVLISLLFVLWVGYYLYNKEVNGWFKGYPDRLRQFWNSLFVLTALVMIKDYPEEFMTLVYFLSSIPGFILNLFLTLWNLISEYYSVILVIVPTIIFLNLLVKLDKLEKKEEYSKLGKISSFLEKSSSLLLGFFFVILAFSWGMIFKQGIIQINLLALVLIILSFIFPLVLFLIPIKETTKIYVLDTEFILIIRKTLEELRTHSFWIPDSKINFLVEQAISNSFFTKENFREKCSDLFDLRLSNFPEENKVYLLGRVLGEYDKKTVPSLKKLFNEEKYEWSNDWEKWDLIFNLVVLEMSFKESLKSIEESKKTKEVKEEKSEKFIKNLLLGLKIVFFPLVLLWKIGVSLAVIKKIWNKFNEVCPYVYKPKELY
ncbi:hypothetical protein CO037_00165 [Candidatus Pacearchaeota archaeon CG_4_9_14_0_2_um_filter_30_8]|nr:MAG: hypothetical protein CO037_00165 [Candidatus Pacearchaeota archaeon CG_4_9_14_0_2_um_filter_30_8]